MYLRFKLKESAGRGFRGQGYEGVKLGQLRVDLGERPEFLELALFFMYAKQEATRIPNSNSG